MDIISINTTTQVLTTTTNALMTIGEYVVVEVGIEWGGKNISSRKKKKKIYKKNLGEGGAGGERQGEWQQNTT